MDDLCQKTIMITKKYHLKLSKQTFVVITQKSHRIAFTLEIFIKIINFMNKMNELTPNMIVFCDNIPLKLSKKSFIVVRY